MSPERAKQIITDCHRTLGHNFSKHCTSDEDKEVRDLWMTMPDHTCWYDALLRIAYPDRHYTAIDEIVEP